MHDMVQNHSKKEKELNDEINTIKEAYRRAMADYEREKDTKETLQQCLEAFQKNSENERRARKSHDDPNPETSINRNEGGGNNRMIRVCRFFNQKFGCRNGDNCSFEHKSMPTCQSPQCKGKNCNLDHKTKAPPMVANSSPIQLHGKRCHFFNRRTGCKNGSKCRFEHVTMPPCPNKRNCNSRGCELDHKNNNEAWGNDDHLNRGFLEASPLPKDPDPSTQQENFMKNIELKIQQAVEKAITKRVASSQANREDLTLTEKGKTGTAIWNLNPANRPPVDQQYNSMKHLDNLPMKNKTNNINPFPTPNNPVPNYYQSQQNMPQVNLTPYNQPPQVYKYPVYPFQANPNHQTTSNLYQMHQMQMPPAVNSF